MFLYGDLRRRGGDVITVLFKATKGELYRNIQRNSWGHATQVGYNIRPRPHGFLLPSKDDRNFIYWLLYKDMY